MKIKEKIIGRINSIKDEATLEEIYRLISVQSEIDEIYHFTPEERSSIEKGIADADNGRLISQEDSEILFKKWIKEKSIGQ
ncbi:MAG TPA: hypothetical protein VFI78_00445 [Salinimicrobium sp.]|nr:hypothetical protein [Salinimicrobium sp.]